ncbi:MAG TPA: DNA polymerase III subunit gamma/tau [Gammaproteobacteria bacterium]|nr:DNA polymerase III subunit gamma/tau [Gammaproteobacteria bacterium]
MSYQVLARKWRPSNFQQLVGQEHVLQALVNALDANRLHHAYLFTGTRGVGKTTIARIFAKSLNCEQGIVSEPCGECSSCREIDDGRSVDLIEIDAASRTGVDDMRELLDNVQYAPTRGRFKIYLIDEVHMLSRHSFNALLKTLEEPPPHVKFLLATTDPQKVPVTVLSRCLQFNLKRMSRAQILGQLQYLMEQEGVDAETAALGQLASAADGSMRDALSLLDQAIGYGGGTVSQQAVEAMLGSISHDSLLRLFEALKARQAPEILRAARAVIEHNPDYQRICADMIGLLQQVALYQNDPRLVDGEEFPQEVLQQYADAWAAEEVQLYYQILLQGRHDLLICPDQASGFEMLMLRLLAFAPAAASETLSEEVKKKPESRRGLSAEPAVATVPAEAVEPEKAKPAQIVQPDCARQPAPQAIDADSTTVGHKAASDLEWSRLAYQLGLGGLAQEIAANSQLETCAADRLRLLLLPEIRELATAGIESEIRQALEQKLGVSLQLELAASESLSAETPLEAKTRRLELERLRAIEAIREDEAVLKLKRAFAVELDETSVVRIDSNENEEVS